MSPGSPLVRLYHYQKERFPVLSHGLLIAAFSFSAIAFSRLCRGESDFIPIPLYLICLANNLILFFLVRVFDEHKDEEEDRLYRPYLPVPRGLVSLKELRLVASVLFVLQTALNLLVDVRLLLLYGLAFGYLCLMGKEFFAPRWLKSRLWLYVASHMMIIPLIDLYASAYDWLLSGHAAHPGLLFFFGVSFLNGCVLEIGRKIRSPEREEPGVVSYTARLGIPKAAALWSGLVALTFLMAVLAAAWAGHGWIEYVVLVLLLVFCLAVAAVFLRLKTAQTAKAVEIASGIWTIGMYLSLGGIPMILKLVGGLFA